MKKIIFIIVLIVISFILYVNVNASVIIPKDAIRVRVVPNSDSVYDQNIKDKVKKYVSNYMSIKLKDVYSVKKARKIINDSIPELEEDIQNIFNNNNYDEDFKIIFGDNYFPDKVYKGVIYNEGDYESLVIYIGEAKGDNWWCVLFPPLCLLEASESETGEVEYRSIVRDIIDKIF